MSLYPWLLADGKSAIIYADVCVASDFYTALRNGGALNG